MSKQEFDSTIDGADSGSAQGRSFPGVRMIAAQVDRFRYAWFALIGLMMLLTFNGKWRIEPDSAIFRQLGHQLATTGRYFVREKVPGVLDYHYKQGTVYPGFPVFLCWMEKIFGSEEKSVMPVVATLNLMAILTLVFFYRVMLYHIPRWQAVCAIVGMGTNAGFLNLTNEIMSDIPFLMGVGLACLGFEWLVRASGLQKIGTSAATLFVGLLIATTLRPTFYFLDGALGLACIWIFWKGRLGWSAIDQPTIPDKYQYPSPRTEVATDLRSRIFLVIGLMLITFVLFRFLLDIRDKQTTGIASGGYESRVASNFKDYDHKLLPRLKANIGEMFETCIPQAVLGYRSSVGIIPMGNHKLGLSTLFGLVLIFSGIVLGRRQFFWGAFVAITIALLTVSGPVPRYILMVLPFFMVAWGTVVVKVASRFKSPVHQLWAAQMGFGYILISNILSSLVLILVQRGYTSPMNEQHHWQKIRYVGFEKTYRDGYWSRIDDLVAMLKKELKPDEKIMGPSGGVLTFLSQRQVFGPQKEIIFEMLRPDKEDQIFKYALFPTEERMKIARKTKPSPVEAPNYDQDFGKHVDAGRIGPGKQIAGPAFGYNLCEVIVKKGTGQ